MNYRSFFHIFLENKKLENNAKKKVLKRELNSFSEKEKIDSYSKLSQEEISQLKIGHKEGYVSLEEWPMVRDFLLQKSLKSNSLTNPELCAYSPGETIHLLNHSIVKEYHSNIRNYKVPDEYDTIILVPCAKSKPWLNCKKGSLYPSYNKIKEEHKNVYFVTISEPLAIVPQSLWNLFPQYDNPGLFKDPVMRSSMFTKDWENLLERKGRLKTPFDPDAYRFCIEYLGKIIREFLNNNSDKKVISFLEDFKGKGTHSEMIDFANLVKPEHRFLKREEPRKPPYSFIKSKL